MEALASLPQKRGTSRGRQWASHLSPALRAVWETGGFVSDSYMAYHSRQGLAGWLRVALGEVAVLLQSAEAKHAQGFQCTRCGPCARDHLRTALGSGIRRPRVEKVELG